MVTASSHVRPSPSSCASASPILHGLDDEKYKKALSMMRVQRKKATHLTVDRLAETDNARADLDVASATIQPRNTSIAAALKKEVRLRHDLVRVNVEARVVASLRRDNDKLLADLNDKHAETARLR